MSIFFNTTISPKSAATDGIVVAVAFLNAHSWKFVAHQDGHYCFLTKTRSLISSLPV